MKHGLVLALAAILLAGVHAQAAAPAGGAAAPPRPVRGKSPAQPAPAALVLPAHLGPRPTRLQLCRFEAQASDEKVSKAKFSECLRRRGEGEQLLAKACKSEAARTGQTPAQRYRLQHDCERRAHVTPYAQLPQKPRPKADAAPAPVTPAPAAPAASAVSVR